MCRGARHLTAKRVVSGRPGSAGQGTTLPTKHDQNRAEKRERLLHSAIEVFTEAGFENATVSDVVHRAGMTPSTFYNYYRDKDALRDELVAQAGARMVRGLVAIRAEAGDSEGYVSSACRGLFEALVEDEPMTLLFRRNLPVLRSLVEDRALGPVYAALKSDFTNAAGTGAGPLEVDYACSTMRALTVEIAVQLLAQETPDVEGAVVYITRVMTAALAKS